MHSVVTHMQSMFTYQPLNFKLTVNGWFYA